MASSTGLGKSSSKAPSKNATSAGNRKGASVGASGAGASGGPSSSSEASREPTSDAGPPVYASDVIAMAEAEGGALSLPEVPGNVPMQDRPGLILRMAEEAFAKTGSWVVFYRAMLAPGGIVDQLYDGPEARRYFETTDEFADLLEMVAAVRSQDDSKSNAFEPERVITVRLPRSMHESVVREAEELELSINSYCLTKLLQPAGARFTPVESGKRRGRRPGPQVTFERVKVKVDKQSSKPGKLKPKK